MEGKSIDWSKIDWSKPNDEIAKDTGYAESTVSYRRRGYHERHIKRAEYWINWTGADWTKSNVDLAAYYQCTPQAAACARRIHAPASLKISPSSRTRNKRRQAVIDERIARATAIMVNAKPQQKPAQIGILGRLLQFVGFKLN